MIRQYTHGLRLEWAIQHLQSFNAERVRWLRREPYRLVEEFDAQRGENQLWIKDIQRPPAQLGLIIGDIAHNLRSALDNLVYELVVACHGDPPPDRFVRYSEFPIFGPQAMSSAVRKRRIGGIAPRAQAIIEGLQPYHRGNDYASDPLWVLYELSNIDKHRRLHLTPFVTRSPWFAVARDVDVDFVRHVNVYHPGGPLEGDTVLVGYPRVPKDKMKMQFEFLFNVTFGKGSPAYGEPVWDTFMKLRDYILYWIVLPLRRFLR